ncbi:MAG TPA: hypothetical protein DCQ47_07575 [Gammaproteobacteria bacterium]|nr:hypothetical protein [Gammaproteobacteria bacterium]
MNGLLGDIETIRKRATHSKFFAVPGPPASGKKTSGPKLANRLTNCSYLCLDGVHLDNSILIEKGLRNRQESPTTSVVNGLAHLLQRLKKEKFYIPTYDRDKEHTINCACPIPGHDDLIIVEGNWLVFNELIWQDLKICWDPDGFRGNRPKIIETKTYKTLDRSRF